MRRSRVLDPMGVCGLVVFPKNGAGDKLVKLIGRGMFGFLGLETACRWLTPEPERLVDVPDIDSAGWRTDGEYCVPPEIVERLQVIGSGELHVSAVCRFSDWELPLQFLQLTAVEVLAQGQADDYAMRHAVIARRAANSFPLRRDAIGDEDSELLFRLPEGVEVAFGDVQAACSGLWSGLDQLLDGSRPAIVFKLPGAVARARFAAQSARDTIDDVCFREWWTKLLAVFKINLGRPWANGRRVLLDATTRVHGFAGPEPGLFIEFPPASQAEEEEDAGFEFGVLALDRAVVNEPFPAAAQC